MAVTIKQVATMGNVQNYEGDRLCATANSERIKGLCFVIAGVNCSEILS